MAVSPDGADVFVTGSSNTAATAEDYATIAYDASTGAQVWMQIYNGGNYDYATSVAASPDGSKVFVTGASDGRSNLDFVTIAYDAATGAQLWLSRYDGPGRGDDNAFALGVSPDGSMVFVSGSSIGRVGGFDYATIAYDALTGAGKWVQRYDGPAHQDDAVTHLAVSPDGSRVFVAGGSRNSDNNSDFVTIAYDASSGTPDWLERYDGRAHGNDAPAAITVSSDSSRVFVTGPSTGSPPGDDDYATLSYDSSTGAKRWLQRYDGPGHQSDDPTDVQISPDGSKVFVTGLSIGVGLDGVDWATLAYDASTGARQWLQRYSGDFALALGVSPDGSEVFVTGDTPGGAMGGGYGTVAYSAADGARLWLSIYSGPVGGQNTASNLAVSPDGSRVFVSGVSQGAYQTFDWATVGYSIT